jgi:hypothetical protein
MQSEKNLLLSSPLGTRRACPVTTTYPLGNADLTPKDATLLTVRLFLGVHRLANGVHPPENVYPLGHVHQANVHRWSNVYR